MQIRKKNRGVSQKGKQNKTKQYNIYKINTFLMQLIPLKSMRAYLHQITSSTP